LQSALQREEEDVMATSPTFLFHGYALGFGAAFRRPFYASIPSQASAVVSIGGGYAYEHSGPSKFVNGVSFDEATSEVSGGPDEESGTFITIATSTVRNLRILGDAVEVDEMTSRLVSRHSGQSGAEPSISAEGSFIKGLRIGGVEIDTGKYLDLPDTDEGFRDKYGANPGWAGHIQQTCNWVRPSAATHPNIHPELIALYEPGWNAGYKTPPTFNGRMMLSIFDGLTAVTSDPRVVVMGNAVTLENVGRFHLGELLIERGNRRLSMLRFSLGSDTEGTGSGAHSGVNGSGYP
jgi:hypothetical protein